MQKVKYLMKQYIVMLYKYIQQNAKGKISYEAEVNRKDVIFDENGNFVKAEI